MKIQMGAPVVDGLKTSIVPCCHCRIETVRVKRDVGGYGHCCDDSGAESVRGWAHKWTGHRHHPAPVASG